ncbi:MAG: aminotransferase class III-fold pyridoxal phosphate-dependent enzyme, partial [Acidobacteria bacterium]|nr:aminotransferase class III-fold pyridoxal phosphate-dependent enzyme [Acidobacteriota bacterium]
RALRRHMYLPSLKHPVIGDVRGLGLMQGAEFVGPGKEPDPVTTSRVVEAARRRGVLIGKGGMWGNVLRLAPPLIVKDGQIDELLNVLDQSLTEATGKSGRA